MENSNKLESIPDSVGHLDMFLNKRKVHEYKINEESYREREREMKWKQK